MVRAMRLIIAVLVMAAVGCFGASGEYESCATACAKQGRAMASCNAAGCVCEPAADAGAGQ